MTEKIPYWKSSSLLGAFRWKDGEEGCEMCAGEEAKLSLDRPPPPLRDQPKPVKPAKPPVEKEDAFVNIINAPWKIIDAVRRVQDWAATPEPTKPAASPKSPRIVPIKKPRRLKFSKYR